MDNNNMQQQGSSYTQQTGQAQNDYMQPMYPQQGVQQPFDTDEVTVGDWMLTIFIICIPILNFIMLLIWAFGDSTPVSKANFCKAQLIWMLIAVCLSIIAVILMVFVGFGLIGSFVGSVL